MSISERAQTAAQTVYAVLQASPDEAQAAEVSRVIERAIVSAMLDQAERYSHAVVRCCSPDLDTAHKIADQLRRENEALMANLSSMR